MAKMNPEVKELWIAALLSKKYEQAPGQLKTQAGGFCCLGVLCDVFINRGEAPAELGWGDNFLDNRKISGHWAGPTDAVNAWADMPSEYWSPDDELVLIEDRLTSMNDDEGQTFEDIAAWIQENL